MNLFEENSLVPGYALPKETHRLQVMDRCCLLSSYVPLSLTNSTANKDPRYGLELTYTAYDSRANPLEYVLRNGLHTRLEWNVYNPGIVPFSVFTSETSNYNTAASLTTRYAYDGRGYLARITDALGQVTQLSHDSLGRLRARSLPDASHETFAYDDAGRLVQANDPLSRVTHLAYNVHSQLVTRQDAEGRQVQLAYDIAQRLATLVNENGQHFAFRYDLADRMVEENRVGGQRVTVEYDANGWPVAVNHHPGVSDLPADPSSSASGALRTELIRDATGRLVGKRTAAHHYRYTYDPLDQITVAQKLRVQADGSLQPLHTSAFAYDTAGNLIEETVTDEVTGDSHTLRHSHDPLGNRIQTSLPTLQGQPHLERALNYLHYGSGHLHQINYSQRDTRNPDALAVHQLICDIERDALHRETHRTQGLVQTRYALDALGRRQGAWSQSVDQRTQPYQASDIHWQRAVLSAGTPDQNPLDGLMKAYAYDKVGELRQSRHSLRGDLGHRYDATGRVEQTLRQPFAGSPPAMAAANSEDFRYDPAGNILDSQSLAMLANRTQHLQEGYVRDNLVRVYEDKRYSYDGHGRLIQKLSGKHTAQTFEWDEENRLTAVTTTRRPGTEHQSTQATRFAYDALGRRVAKQDRFGTTVFIWEGMRLIEERRGSSAISYVYEPDSYVPLARLDASGVATEEGGLGTTQDPTPQARESKTIAASPLTASASGQNLSAPVTATAANDTESQYWAALETQAQRQSSLGTGTHGPTAQAPLCEVYYFHTDQVGLPEELSNAQGQLVWQAQYKTWGRTVEERWEARRLHGAKVQGQTQGDIPQEELQEQNLRFQGQYLDRETGLHYNTFRYYDADIGRFISPDPIGLWGDTNLHTYSPNPVIWIDPWGWSCSSNAKELRGNMAREGRVVKPGEAAGHIVASGGSKGSWAPAVKSRALLQKYKIGINDGANGIPVGHPNPHGRMHTGSYNQKVYDRLSGVEQRMQSQGYGRNAIRSALRRELRDIGREPL
ncbi:MAG: hypothetical protein EON54_06795 [Alcaligenaceae bacterium]|nr:MAG: hypothetical protein EON54_06795 [Alcaligenaceae bacterium]